MTFNYIQLILVLVSITLAAPLNSASPTSLDKATLHQNGLDAQKLNAQFKTLKATDPCKEGQEACISHAIARCANGSWDTTSGRCSKSQNCFALPSVTSNGTTITCTSHKSALSLFEAVGVTGGTAGLDSSTAGSANGDQTGNPMTNDGRIPSTATMSLSITAPSLSAAIPATAITTDSNINRITVTVTVTAMPTSFVKTRTISPQEASQIVSSLTADGQATVLTKTKHNPCRMTSVPSSPVAPNPTDDGLLTYSSTTIPSTVAY
ncbi:hypothetical protein AX17_004719 [Amanita inopinata Kibby_2008]|nr:hypothetical protein AX17_004719 [Amanita inopinata Kibby_2008]